jgi:hypothetical protein
MKTTSHKRILALYLHSLSFGFVVFQGQDGLIDWGVKSFRGGVNAVKVPINVKLTLLLDRWEPDLVIINGGTGARLEKVVHMIELLSSARKIPVHLVSRSSVRDAFPESNQDKYQIAGVIARRYPELAPRLPDRPKLWQSERYAMKVFDAVALGVAYFLQNKTERTSSPLPR